MNGKSKEIPAERLVAKMLCKHHNEELSDLDAAAGHFFQVLKAFGERAAKRARGAKKPGGPDIYRVDGAAVEKWMLKTVININHGRRLATGVRWAPSKEWVELVFGRRAFEEFCGFYFLEGEGKLDEGPVSALGVRLFTKQQEGGTLLFGGQFRIESLQFAVSTEPLHVRHRPSYRIKRIREKPSLDLLQLINFDWSGVAVAG